MDSGQQQEPLTHLYLSRRITDIEKAMNSKLELLARKADVAEEAISHQKLRLDKAAFKLKEFQERVAELEKEKQDGT